ncbi:predicted protein [Histoplasma capsulatum var. duboisii H88]|uniref:Predicted protein n=1 Tax=Ajellomyces capsulatus (strain H88) TaxID=544711 RepID=F0UJZ1_AJEC8|nr:predicted protein [Histoplasma capsulatum var. duboisii H88]
MLKAALTNPGRLTPIETEMHFIYRLATFREVTGTKQMGTVMAAIGSAKSCQKSIAKVAGLEALGFYQRGFFTHYHQAASRAIWHKALRAFIQIRPHLTVLRQNIEEYRESFSEFRYENKCNSRPLAQLKTKGARGPSCRPLSITNCSASSDHDGIGGLEALSRRHNPPTTQTNCSRYFDDPSSALQQSSIIWHID